MLRIKDASEDVYSLFPFSVFSSSSFSTTTGCVTLLLVLTWQWRMMVHMSPRMMEGRPSVISEMFMFTSLTCVKQAQQMCIKHTEDYNVVGFFFFHFWQLTDFFLRKFSAVSMFALCWKTPRPLCLFCGDIYIFTFSLACFCATLTFVLPCKCSL